VSPFRRETGVWWTRIRGVKVSLRTKDEKRAKKLEARLVDADDLDALGLQRRDVNPRGLTLTEAMRRAMKQQKRSKTDQLVYTLEKHIAGDPIGALALEDVTRSIVKAWLLRRHERGVSAATANHLRAYLSSIFTGLIEDELFFGENPVKHTRLMPTDAPEGRALPWHYVPALIEHAPSPEWARRFLLAAFTGMRMGELRALRWEQVDLEARFLRVVKSKTGVPRMVPLHRDVVQALRSVARKSGPVFSAAGWQKAGVRVRAALERAELDYEGATFHGLRGAWATRMIDCGADHATVQLIGWGARGVMQRHYIRPSSALLAAIDLLSYAPAEVVALPKKLRGVK
jgi:integrase